MSNAEMEDHITLMKMAKVDIKNQFEGLRTSTGDVQSSYRKVILDKIWKLSQYNGIFYHKCLAAISALEAKVLEEVPLGGGQYAYPQIEKMLEKTHQPSDIPVAVIKSVPSFPHPPSFE